MGFQGASAERVQLTPCARDTVLAHYTIWQFDPRGQQLAEAACILHRGEPARTFALGFFTTKAGRPAPLTGLGALGALSATPVTRLSAISAGTICYWIDGTTDVECDGMRCFVLFTTRAAANQRWQSAARADTAVRVPVGPSHLTALECTNGGVLALNPNGTATYHPPGGGGDGGGGGGSGGPGNPCGGGGTGDPPTTGRPTHPAVAGRTTRGGGRCVIRWSYLHHSTARTRIRSVSRKWTRLKLRGSRRR